MPQPPGDLLSTVCPSPKTPSQREGAQDVCDILGPLVKQIEDWLNTQEVSAREQKAWQSRIEELLQGVEEKSHLYEEFACQMLCRPSCHSHTALRVGPFKQQLSRKSIFESAEREVQDRDIRKSIFESAEREVQDRDTRTEPAMSNGEERVSKRRDRKALDMIAQGESGAKVETSEWLDSPKTNKPSALDDDGASAGTLVKSLGESGRQAGEGTIDTPLTPTQGNANLLRRETIAGRGFESISSDKTASTHWREMIRKQRVKTKYSDPVSERAKQKEKQHLSWTRRQLRSHSYESFMMALVCTNVGWIGCSVQYYSKNKRPLPGEDVFEAAFCILFTLELIGRIFTERASFLEQPELSWNAFDTAVVLVMIVEQMMAMVKTATSINLHQLSILRVFRILRIWRALRIIRVLAFFRELRMMVRSITSSLLSLMWALMVLGMLFYVFGIVLTQGVIDHCQSKEWSDCRGTKLDKYFGSLGSSVLSLFESMAGGISWHELVEALEPLSFVYTGLFLVFISFAIFAVVNIVTGIFVDSAMRSAQQDRDAVIQETMVQKKSYVDAIHQVFSELDIDKNGTIGIEEFEAAVDDVKMVAYFGSLGLDLADAQTLFVLLDRDQTGQVDIEEFLVGCMRLKGEAKSLDMAKMLYEIEWLVHNMDTLIGAINQM